MTSTLSVGPEHQGLEGRTVRDIAEHDPAQVNETFCRKIFRQLLQSLELQHAMHMPHRAITPDTVVFHDNGEPLLLPSGIATAEPEQDEAADLNALARVVHFAITRELAPSGPLRGRAPEGYSDSLISAVDRCMSPDPAERPRTIDELRNILGIVSLGPAVAAGAQLATGAARMRAEPLAQEHAMASAAAAATASSTAPASMPAFAQATATAIAPASVAPAAGPPTPPSFMREPHAPRHGTGLSRWQRWALAAGGGAVLLAVALALFAELRDSGSYDHIVLSLPQSGQQADRQASRPSGEPARSDAASAPAPLAQAEPDGTANPAAVRAQNGGAEAAAPAAQAAVDSALEAQQPQAQPNLPALAARRPGAVPANRAAAPGIAASTTYKLHIQPWGVVYVDGVDRGVSPPVKRLVLPPGRHTIRIANPNFHDRVLEVDTSAGGGQIGVDFSDEPK